jgi:hypothetical protein
VDFEKHGARNDRSHGYDRWIEAFHMADLQDAAAASCGGDQRIGIIERGGHGLFDQHVEPGIEEPATDPGMLPGGNSEADSVDILGEKVPLIADGARAEFRGRSCGAVGIGVDNRHKLDAREIVPHAHVVAPKLAGANHRDSNGFSVHDFFFGSAF